jgi:hypothetical protein
MNPIEFVRGFLLDLWRLPLFFQLVVLGMVVAWAWRWQKSQRLKKLQEAALSWPTYRARVVWAEVSDRKKESKHGPAYWEGLLTCSYAAPGQELEVGEYRQRFYNAATADAWARGLRDSFVNVRVDPADPKRSVWLDEDGKAAAAAAAELASRQPSDERWEGAGRAVMAGAVFAFAGLGAAAALWIQVSCLQGKPIITPERNEGVFFGMHIGVIVCLIAAQALFASGDSRDVKKWFQTTARGVKQPGLLKWLSMYYVAVFFYAWVRLAARDGEPGFWSMFLFSGGWMLGYLSAAGMCWKVLARTEEDRAIN